MPRLSLIVAVGMLIAVGGGAPSASAAAPPLPLGTDGQGVHLDVRRAGPPHRRRVLVLTFDASAAERYRQIAGRTLDVECVHLDRRPTGIEVSGVGGTSQPAPRRRRPIVVGLRPRYDICTVGVQHGRRTTVLTRIALTPLGAVRLDRLMTAETVIAAVSALARPERPSAATVAARFHGVVLDSPAQAPTPEVLGVYSDGVSHVYAAETDRAGELLFVEQDRDVTRTNVMNELADPEPLG